jgi:hypothetical protein
LGLVGRRKRTASVRFVAVNPVESVSSGGAGNGSSIELPAASFIELCLGRDLRLVIRPGFDPHLLREVVAALEGPSL